MTPARTKPEAAPRPPRGPLWRLYERLAMVLGLGSLGMMCMLWLPFAALLYPVLPRRVGQRLGRLVIMWSFRHYLLLLTVACGCRFDLRALDALRRERGLIVAANHPSLLDAVVLVSRLPDAVCVMKASLMDNLLFGAAARLARYVRNDSAHQLIKNGRQSLAEGAQVVLFPEGSRTSRFPLDPLNPSLAVLAKRAQAPVQTVLLEYSTPYLGKHWPLSRPPVLPLSCTARLGQRFAPPEDAQALTAEMERYLRAELGVAL